MQIIASIMFMKKKPHICEEVPAKCDVKCVKCSTNCCQIACMNYMYNPAL